MSLPFPQPARESLGAQPLVADAASDLHGATDAARKLYEGGMLSDQIGSDQTGTADLGPASDQIDSDQIRWIRSDRIAQPCPPLHFPQATLRLSELDSF